jgi:hypothetical protein
MEKENTENSYQKFLEFCSAPDRELYYFGSPSYEKEQEEYRKLYEGLITSYHQDSVKSLLDKNFGNKIYIKKINEERFLIDVFIDKISNEDVLLFKDVYEKINSTYGWICNNWSLIKDKNFFSSSSGNDIFKILNYEKIKDGYVLTFQFEPIHPMKIFDKEKIPKTLYHLSPARYENKILKRGLIPKSKNSKFKHPDRVYVFDSLDDTEKIIQKISEVNEETEWTLYTISNFAFIPSNRELFIDNLFSLDNGTSYFTKRNIRPSNIKKHQRLKIDLETGKITYLK